jgi:hypothetical protein
MSSGEEDAHKIKTPPGTPGAEGLTITCDRRQLRYFFFLVVDFLVDFFEPPFLVAFFIKRFSLT